MTQARASHLRLVVNEPETSRPSTPRLRFRPVLNLTDGIAYGIDAESDRTFEDTWSLHAILRGDAPSASEWLANIIERTAELIAKSNHQARPISIVAPIAILNDPDAPLAAEAAACRGKLLPQEVRIDFPDSALCDLDELALDRIDSFRQRGFRVGLDARRGWRTPMNARARMTFEAIRIDPISAPALDIPLTRMEVAAAEGIALIAENVMWRDAERLADFGVHYAIAPRSDA